MRDAWPTLAVGGGLLVAVFVFAMHDRSRVKSGSLLPRGASNIVEVGEGWFEFTYKGQRFLYRRAGIADQQTECLTVIETQNDEK